MINVIIEFNLLKFTTIIRVVGTASRKASLSAMFCSYSDIFFIPLSGFWYIDLMTLRAAKIKLLVLIKKLCNNPNSYELVISNFTYPKENIHSGI